MKYKSFLFDWDGCLADTLPIWFGGMKAGLAYFNVEVPDNIIKKGFQGWEIFPELGVSDMDLFTEQVYKYVNKNLCNIQLNEGVIEILDMLKEKEIKFAIVTTTEKEKIYPVLERFNLPDFFNVIIDRNDVKKLKPDCEAIDKALETIRGDKALTAMVGDSEVDIKAGKNAGISTIWFSPKDNKEFHWHFNDRVMPDYTIGNFYELERYF
ncbi:MAG: HAD-IA family hydrolase [Bacteroidales bacterium]|jgi:HAD superfamily hydrolase (TIGR01549 family)|nr:HAD-IA family hydrolase [Bacteroidales bacterium]